MSKFILDTNVLITAYRLNYPMDVLPSFWEKLLIEAEKESFMLIDKVVDEINKGEDELKSWIKSNKEKITILNSADINVINSYKEVIKLAVNNPNYNNIAKDDFAEKADSWLIAHAHAYGYTVVTQEAFDKNIKKRIPIPNICLELNVKCVNTITFLRAIGMKI